MKQRNKFPKNICIFSGDISRGGGTERVAAFLANSLTETGRFSVSIVSITESSLLHFDILPQIPRFQLSEHWINPGLGYLPLIFRLYHLIKQQKFTVIIDVDNVLDVLTIPCRMLTGIYIISWEQFHFHQTLGTCYRSLFRHFSCHFADHIVTLTEHDAATYQKEGHPRCTVTPIHNAANITNFPIPICQKENIVLAMGNLLEIKGFDMLIETARILVPQFPDWKFYIYGEGEKRRELEAMIQAYHLENHVFLPGFCKNIAPVFAKASIFLLTSRSEGLPMVLLEAKAFRLPSVSFDISNGPAEIILDQVNGFLVPAFDIECMAKKLSELMSDSKLRDSFSHHAWDNIEKFDKNKIISQWISLIENIYIKSR